MGRQRKKRNMKNKKSDTEEVTYESESILNTGVASSSIINSSVSKPESLKDNYKCQGESSSNIGESRSVLVPSRNQSSASRTQTSTGVFRAETMDTSITEKQLGPSTSEPRLHRTSLKVHISRCIRRRTWREPKEFRPSPEELLITYGVNAYQYWARNKNKDITKGSKRYKEDILAVPLHQWNKILSAFIQTISDPNGHTLSGGAILYIILGLQLYIFTHNRTDNLFFDDSFTVFSRALCELLASREKAIQYGRSLSLIEEDTLWLSGQLGGHSPAVLLTSIMYFNTKYFKLRTVKSHANLCFKNICLYYMSMASGKKSAALSYQPEEVIDLTDEDKMETDEPKEESVIYDQFSIEDSIRCPVQLYKFYVSKCAKTARGKDNKVYLTPIRDCSPDSECWFSPDPLPEVKIFRMLQTFRYVQEIKEQF